MPLKEAVVVKLTKSLVNINDSPNLAETSAILVSVIEKVSSLLFSFTLALLPLPEPSKIS